MTRYRLLFRRIESAPKQALDKARIKRILVIQEPAKSGVEMDT